MEFVNTCIKDNLILKGMFYEPKKQNNVAVLHIHGMSGNCWENEFIEKMSEDYPNSGIGFLTVETRGSEILRWFYKKDNTTQLIGNAHEIFEDCIKDIEAWVSFLKTKGYKEIYLQGHSLGCAKIAYFKSLSGEKAVKGLIFIAPSDMIGLVIEPSNIEKHKRLLKEAGELAKKGKENSILSEMVFDFAFLSAKTYLNFFQENSKTAIFNYYKPSLGFEIIKKINVPILAILGTKDDAVIGNPKESLDLLKKNAVNCPKFVNCIIEGAEHDYSGFEGDVTKSVIQFINKIKNA